MQIKGKRLRNGKVFINADPWYAGKLDDPQGGDTTIGIAKHNGIIDSCVSDGSRIIVTF